MTDCAEVLAAVDIFADFPQDFLGRVAEVAELRSYAAGEAIVRQDEPATAFYVVTRGSLEVMRGDQPIATLEMGRFFGEMALLREGTRTATVRAREAAECLVLAKSAFDRELRRDPNSAAVLATRLARRINAIRPVAGS